MSTPNDLMSAMNLIAGACGLPQIYTTAPPVVVPPTPIKPAGPPQPGQPGYAGPGLGGGGYVDPGTKPSVPAPVAPVIPAGQPGSGYSSRYPDAVPKSPAPTDTDAAFLFLCNGVDARIPLTRGTTRATNGGMYPDRAIFNGVYATQGVTKEEILRLHLLCLSYFGLPSNDLETNNRQRQSAYSSGHQNMEQAITTHFSYVTASDPRRDQIVSN